jgi:Tol biopolymer transport system component
MRQARTLFALSLTAALLFTHAAADTAAPQDDGTGDSGPTNESLLLSNTRQLIFEGRRSGEGYFSADGSQMVFQSEREPGNPFYQIYLMDMETGDTSRVSTGTGRTTCAWIHPNADRVLFSSTHEDPAAEDKQRQELDKRAQGQASRYSWSYDPNYEIYEVDTAGGEPRRLTDALGYDAEGSWSPDGGSIIFASNRHAYAGNPDAETIAALDKDASRYMELYLMDADGGNVRRLTDNDGYDGGPFFSADGSRIVWRRFTPDGKTAEIWIAAADGSNPRQITELGVMSWAPYFHPSGDYLIFATNVHGYANFELYLVDTAGERAPVRVTETKGFDGLPVFTPDGARLAWASGRTATKQAQIFIADWNDAAARELLGLPPAGAVSASAPQPRSPAQALPAVDQTRAPSLPATAPQIDVEDLRAHVDALTAEAMAGRRTGTAGSALATDYVARAMAAIGLEPAADLVGHAGQWFQPFEFTSETLVQAGTRLTLDPGTGDAVPLRQDQDWRPLAFSRPGAVDPARVVFAGYGIIAPGDEGNAGFDSYGELDVAGKWVMLLRDLPSSLSAERRKDLIDYADPRYKALVAREQGALGIILAASADMSANKQLLPLTLETGAGGDSIPAVSVSADAAAWIAVAGGADLYDLQRRADAGEAVTAEFAEVRLGADIQLSYTRATDRNVLGRLAAGAEPTPRVVIIGAHVDHIGDARGLSSRADLEGQIHPGADDNASGVAALLEMAEHLAARKAAGKLNLEHDIIFASWTGEELGRLGSAAFAEALGDADGGLGRRVLAYLNLDMVGRLDDVLYIQGVGSSTAWRGEIERRNAPVGLPIRIQEAAYLPTDTTPFYLAGTPILSFFTGAHQDYNTPDDTADRLNYHGLAKVSKLVGLLAGAVARGGVEPEYVLQEKPGAGITRAKLRATLGTIPAYADTEAAGVLLDGVSDGGPAEAGGLQAGDIITALDGQAIEDIHDFMFALNKLRVGEPVPVQVRRGDAVTQLSVTPAARQ